VRRIFLAVLLLLIAGSVAADTAVSGTIATNTTWSLAGSPYVLTGDVSVGGTSAPVLTIDAGVVVKGNSHAQLLVNVSAAGAIQANGTSASPILFTSNGTATAGYWYGLRLGNTAGAPASSLSYTNVEYAGSTTYSVAGVLILGGAPTLDHVISRNHQYAGFRIDGGAPVFTSCESRSNANYGIYMNAGSATFTDLVVASNTGKALSAPGDSELLGMGGMSMTGNGTNGVELRGATIAANRTWRTCAAPYLIAGAIRVEGPAAPVLTIEPGTTFKFASGTNLIINDHASGGLVANGTSAAPILFTSSAATPSAGSWYGVAFGATASPPASSISYATVEYAGSTAYSVGGINITGIAPSLDHVTARLSAHAGIRIEGGATPSISNCDVRQNSGIGINIVAGGATLTDTSLTSNTGLAMTMPADAGMTGMTGLSATGNGTNAVELRPTTIAANRTWRASAVPYLVSGNVLVEGAAAPILTIEPGATVRFASGGQLTINANNKGGLQANGTSASPIILTSSTASPGSWRGLYLGGFAGGPASSVAYTTIEYAGNTSYTIGGLTIAGGAHVVDHATIRNNTYGGAVILGGTSTISNSTISNNSGPGVRGMGAATLALTGDAFTNNAGYAISLPTNLGLSDASSLTATGNTGGNAIEVRSGFITSDTTWPTASLPYILTGAITVEGPAAPILTIAAGNSVRFASNTQIVAANADKGALRANGTAAAPILFTANGSTTAGFWYGLLLGDFAGSPASSLSFATIEYAGSSTYQRGGLTVNGLSPQLDHLTLRNNAVAGLVATRSATPRITNSVFAANPAGVLVTQTAQVFASLNYWGSAAGACAPGSCATGQQSVSGNAIAEPWLVAAPTTAQYLTSALQRNRAFSPAIAVQTKLDYGLLVSGSAAVTFRDAGGNSVRTFTTSGTTGAIAWDGKNDSGTAQPNGTYSYEIAATAPSLPPATIARGVAVIDSSRGLVVGTPATQAFFSPNGDSVQDTSPIASTANYDDTTWTVSLLDAASNVVRAQNGSGAAIGFTWDGRNAVGTVAPDGAYTVRIDAAVGTATANVSGTTTLDTTPPAIAITSPTSGYVVSNVYLNGGTSISPIGNVADANLKDWTLQQGNGASPAAWWRLNGGTTAVSNASLGTWATATLANGSYAFRLDATDKAGNSASTPVLPVVVGHFSVTQSGYQFNGVGGQTVTYSSSLPFPLTETLTIRNAAGSVVRNLVVSNARNAGTFNDAWNGLDDGGAVLPDAPYFYLATVTDGTHTFTLDHSTDYRNDLAAENDGLVIPEWDPYNNRPLRFTYSFNQPALVTIATSTLGSSVGGDCSAPSPTFYCPVIDLWQPAGTHTFSWAGVDNTGAYREIRGIGIRAATTGWPTNAVVLYGTQTIVDNVRVTPAVFGPGTGTPQTIAFDLQTYLSRPATVTIALRNLESRTFLRTITLPNTAPGHVTATWDGQADNGMPVAPGFYQVLVTATDPIGNRASGDILTTIKY